MGGEPTFVSIDDMEGAEWKTAALGPTQAAAGRRFARAARSTASPPAACCTWARANGIPANRCRAGRCAATGGRTASRSGRTNRCSPTRPSRARTRSTTPGASARLLAEKLGVEPEHVIDGYEDALYYTWKERRLPANVDSATRSSKTKRNAPGWRACSSKASRRQRRLRAAAAARVVGRRAVLGKRRVARAQRGNVPDPRRLADGLPPADSVAAVVRADRRSKRLATRATRSPTAPAAAALSAASRARRQRTQRRRTPASSSRAAGGRCGGGDYGDGGERRRRRRRRPTRADAARTATARPRPIAMLSATPARPRRPHANGRDADDPVAGRAHGAVRRTARRRAPRLHAAARSAGRLPRPGRRDRSHRRRAADARRDRRLRAAARPAHQPRQGHARPRRDRSQRPARRELGRSSSTSPPASTKTPATRGWAPRSSTSTARTPAPAAATTSCSAAPRRPTARSCGGPICSAAWSATGTTIRRCRTCSPARSSAPRARRRASTKAAATLATNWRSRSSKPSPAATPPPWLVDRVFRHLLVDGTGNTHRAEFCIDKLFSPDSATGRLGLVEFRAFEMPPHARMSLAQQLLLRACVARFWKQPYAEPMVDWDTSLHDRFMLPHFVAAGFPRRDRRDSRRRATPSTRRGSPRTSSSASRASASSRTPNVHVELRKAIEPWYVLGEEGAAGGTARYVDSSVERLQVKVRGMTNPRHVDHLQRPQAAAASHRRRRRICRRRALPGVAAAELPASDDPGRRAAGVRRARSVDEALAGRLHVPRRPSRRAEPLDVPRQRVRGREPPRGAVLQDGPPRRPVGSPRATNRIATTRSRSIFAAGDDTLLGDGQWHAVEDVAP